MGHTILHLPIHSCRVAFHRDNLDRNGMVVLEAVFAGEGEERVDHCDPTSGASQYRFDCDR